MKEKPRRIAKVRGCSVEMLSRNMNISAVIYHARFAEVYDKPEHAKIAAEAWEKRGRAFLASDFRRPVKKSSRRMPLFEQLNQPITEAPV